MASWMVHLRIADRLLDMLPNLSATEFIVGNIAPDSGVPNADWSAFTPNKNISHFKDTNKKVCPENFAAKYFTHSQQRLYNKQQYSFYLGYLVHLLTDRLWSAKIARPTMERFSEELDKDKAGTISKIKDDWYDLDFLYLRHNPDFRAFSVFDGAVGFENTFMEEFSRDAFDNRRAYITDFYRQDNDHLERDYPYLTAESAEKFIAESTTEIIKSLKIYCI